MDRTGSQKSDSLSLLRAYGLPPNDIEVRSFQIIEEALPPLNCTPSERQVIKRLVHTTGDPSITPQIAFHPKAIDSGVSAIRVGCTIFTDVQMVAAGVSKNITASFGCGIKCGIGETDTIQLAREQGITRAAASILSHTDSLDGSIVAIGNAPTALFALLDLIDEGRCKPALIIGMPVGFVGAAESKIELLKREIPFISIIGTRGGSTLAVATVNALLRLA